MATPVCWSAVQCRQACVCSGVCVASGGFANKAVECNVVKGGSVLAYGAVAVTVAGGSGPEVDAQKSRSRARPTSLCCFWSVSQCRMTGQGFPST
ncbi:unnamed protein product [Fusarium graminearum]|uniref:Chromosome 3, complete genome n=1 Tax=Gibberella zeae (strain ATCC MYA-4620 / CBS 123657 / FGSC 9075 / NRRL 31084 / PH-1) TaxID=229533 RepID=A0A098DWX7_GIBZE|nr:unnamed protein product [Fusarium graminearum]CZS85396.1 unnamed protein product [Fusarium graminearum]